MALPLEGIRVLDMSVFQQGSYASAMLADMGADVIKIEAPDHPDPGRGTGLDLSPNGLRPYFEHLNRNKRAIALDLSNEQGRETFLRLVETADIFHNNMRPGVLKRLRLTYDVLAERFTIPYGLRFEEPPPKHLRHIPLNDGLNTLFTLAPKDGV